MLLAHTPIIVHYTILRAQRAFVKTFDKNFNIILTVSASKEFLAFEVIFCGKKKHAAACRKSAVKVSLTPRPVLPFDTIIFIQASLINGRKNQFPIKEKERPKKLSGHHLMYLFSVIFANYTPLSRLLQAGRRTRSVCFRRCCREAFLRSR